MLTLVIVVFGAAVIMAGITVYLTRGIQILSGATLLFLSMVMAAPVFGAVSYPVAHNVAKASAIGGYQQFLNGSIVSYDSEHYECSEDGPCTHEYSCNPYTVLVPVTTTDSKGNVKTTLRMETRYHRCPYTTEEFSYTLRDTFGNEHVIGNHIFSANPRQWGRDTGIPPNVFQGVPLQWQHAVDALKSGNSDPVTVTTEYENYILPSEDTLLKASSDDIALLKQRRLLPEHTQDFQKPIHRFYQANKMSFVGFAPSNAQAWQDSLMHFNAALGMERQGDMHIVAIKASAISDAVSEEDYLNALKAYWLNNLGKHALAKNGIALVLAVDDSASKVVWSKAATGMPVGNGPMLQALSNDLSGLEFTPESILGNTVASKVEMVRATDSKGKQKTKPKATYQIGTGKVAQIVMEDYPFQRACMACKDKKESSQQGFVDLSSQIPLSSTGLIMTAIIDIALIGVIWILLVRRLGVTNWYAPNDYPSARYRPTRPRTPTTKGRKRHV